jgi:hypothetical protein
VVVHGNVFAIKPIKNSKLKKGGGLALKGGGLAAGSLRCSALILPVRNLSDLIFDSIGIDVAIRFQ